MYGYQKVGGLAVELELEVLFPLFPLFLLYIYYLTLREGARRLLYFTTLILCHISEYYGFVASPVCDQ